MHDHYFLEASGFLNKFSFERTRLFPSEIFTILRQVNKGANFLNAFISIKI